MKTKSVKSKEEIMKEIAEKAINLRDIRFGIAGSKGKNVKEYSVLKKDIARLKTELKTKTQ